MGVFCDRLKFGSTVTLAKTKADIAKKGALIAIYLVDSIHSWLVWAEIKVTEPINCLRPVQQSR